MVGMFGDFDEGGSRTQTCFGNLTPGGSCGNFAWISHLNGSLGEPGSAIHYFSPNGECYIESDVPGAEIARRLQNGAPRGERCSRDLIYKNQDSGKITRIPNFLPDKNGNGGSTMVLRMWQTSKCIAECGIASTGGTSAPSSPEPSSGGSGASVVPSGGNPPRTPAPAPPVSVTKEIVDAGGNRSQQTQTIGAAPAVAMPATG
jgi:hypothetical protein